MGNDHTPYPRGQSDNVIPDLALGTLQHSKSWQATVAVQLQPHLESNRTLTGSTTAMIVGKCVARGCVEPQRRSDQNPVHPLVESFSGLPSLLCRLSCGFHPLHFVGRSLSRPGCQVLFYLHFAIHTVASWSEHVSPPYLSQHPGRQVCHS